MRNSAECLAGQKKLRHLMNQFMRYPSLLLSGIMLLFTLQSNLEQIPAFPFQDTATYFSVKDEACGALKNGF